ncbi:MAG TPA: hypothetical protein VFZ22_09040 [Pyrinomonadaceae bacterium]|nr:hypothetical protein [Pyrinomonadaceae bacterium]
MAREAENKNAEAKISPGFAARLEQLGPEEEVRAIVMLRTGGAKGSFKTRPTKKARRATVKNTRDAVTVLLPVIDRILKRHHGKRLKSEIDALGAVPVITTPTGINALTGSEYVKAIIEDQAVYRMA